MKKNVWSFTASYLLLSLYFYLIPTLIPMNDVFRFLHLLSFFPLAYFVARAFFQQGFNSFGLIFFKGWQKNLGLGLAIGFGCWSLLFGLRIFLGEYVVYGVKPFNESLVIVIVVCLGFGVGSLISDMIVRGLIFHHFRHQLSFRMLVGVAVLLYAMDDIWLEGLSLNNFIFSVCLGISFAYAFFKTSSIWANTGLHAGLNIAYGLFFGVSGNVGEGIILFQITDTSTVWITWLSSIIALVMFVVLYKCMPWFKQSPIHVEVPSNLPQIRKLESLS